MNIKKIGVACIFFILHKNWVKISTDQPRELCMSSPYLFQKSWFPGQDVRPINYGAHPRFLGSDIKKFHRKEKKLPTWIILPFKSELFQPIIIPPELRCTGEKYNWSKPELLIDFQEDWDTSYSLDSYIQQMPTQCIFRKSLTKNFFSSPSKP